MLAEVAKQKGISLCGIRRQQTTADFSNQNLQPPDAILLASDLSQAVVTGALTKLSLAQPMTRHRVGRGIELGEEGAKFLCDALVGNITLKELDISSSSYNYIIGGTAGAKHVANMLLVNGGLTKISLARNKLGEEGTKAICEALKQNKTLKELKLSGYMGSNIGGAAGAKHVADMLGVNSGLTSLDLSNNLLCGVTTFGGGTYTAEGITAIAEALRVNGALTSVKLSGNRLGDEGWGVIFAAICGSKDSKIMSLDASCENISPAGVQLIAEALRTSVTGALTRVDVRQNNIAGDGAVQLAAAVLGNFKIEMFNEIPIKEMRANSITELDLNGKDFGVEGVMVVAGLIPVMGALTTVWTSAHDSLSSQY
jgi:hypothetical protein